jgi:hypothetical protein
MEFSSSTSTSTTTTSLPSTSIVEPLNISTNVASGTHDVLDDIATNTSISYTSSSSIQKSSRIYHTLRSSIPSFLIQTTIPSLHLYLYNELHFHHHQNQNQNQNHPHEHQHHRSIHLSKFFRHNGIIQPLQSLARWFNQYIQPVVNDWCFRPFTQGLAFGIGSFLALFIYQRFILQFSIAALHIPVLHEVDTIKQNKMDLQSLQSRKGRLDFAKPWKVSSVSLEKPSITSKSK